MERFNPEKIMSKKEHRERHLNRLKLLMSDFSDEIPEEIIHSNTSGVTNYKVRAAWWSSVSLNMYGLNEKGLISKEDYEEFKQICKFHQKNLDETKRTKKEDIEAVNTFVKRIIQTLENQEVN